MPKWNSDVAVLIAVAGGAIAALSGMFTAKTPVAPEIHAETPAEQQQHSNAPPAPIPRDDEEGTASGSGQRIDGEILERIDVEKYTYFRLGERGRPGTWVAVPSSKHAVGERIAVRGAEPMTKFHSATLNRTFDSIYFGVVDEGGAPASATPLERDNPHANAMSSGTPEPVVGHVKKAEGPTGHDVAELYAKRDELVGHTARVRGVVVKSIPGVLDRTFLHVRDGSGTASAGTNDLTITTTSNPKVGDEILFEGTVTKDRDFGAGYRYPVLLEDAHVM